jgi:hypothetical protein
MAWQTAGKSLFFAQRRTSQLTRVCACGAVSAMAWQTASKFLFFAQRCALSSLVHGVLVIHSSTGGACGIVFRKLLLVTGCFDML